MKLCARALWGMCAVRCPIEVTVEDGKVAKALMTAVLDGATWLLAEGALIAAGSNVE